MAKRATNHVPSDIQPVEKRRAQMWTMAALAAALFVLTVMAACETPKVEKTLALLSCAVVAVMLVVAGKQHLARLASPVSVCVAAYILVAGISTFYARSGKFAIQEYSRMLFAFAVFMIMLLFMKATPQAFRRAAGVLAVSAAPFGLLSIDAASSNLITPPFRALTALFTDGYAHYGEIFYSRLNTILGNPNTYAGLMSVACLLSLYLSMTAVKRQDQIACGILLMVNTVSYLLAFSMGSLAFFAGACLLFLALCPAKRRISLFLLLVETAVIALAVAMLSIRGFGDYVTGSPLPLVMLAAGCVVFCLLDVFVRSRAAAALEGKVKAILTVIAVLVIGVIGYLVAAMQLSGAYTFHDITYFTRTEALPAGDYILQVEANGPVSVRISYKDTSALIQNTDWELAVGSSTEPIAFTVPEGSQLVFMKFYDGTPGTVLSSASFTGPKNGAVKLKYTLLPGFIADRIQDLAANGNVVQRGVYRQDALRMFASSPVIGYGLGGFQNGLASVQDYYYVTRYVHNHYLQMMCDMGIIGLLIFLAMLASTVFAVFKTYKKSPVVAAALGACVLQIFGQAVSDVTWSVAECQPMFFAIMAMCAVQASSEYEEAHRNKTGVTVIRWGTCAWVVLFTVLLCLNLGMRSVMDSGKGTLADMKRGATLDMFEKNDYKITFLLSGGGESDPHTAEIYERDLRTAKLKSHTTLLARYYANIGRFGDMFDVLEEGTTYARGEPAVWQDSISLCQEVAEAYNGENDTEDILQNAEVVQRMQVLIDQYEQTSAAQLAPIPLTEENEDFVERIRNLSGKLS